MASTAENGQVLVDARLGRQPEHPLADDVALDLVGAAGDAVAGRAEHVLGPRERAPLAGVGQQARPEEQGDGVADVRHVGRPHQLAERGLGPRRLAGPQAGGGAAVGQLGDAEVDVDVGQRLAHQRVVRALEVVGQGEDLLVPATDVAAAAASGVVPLEPEAGQRDPPAVADAAEAKVVGEPDVGRGRPR